MRQPGSGRVRFLSTASGSLFLAGLLMTRLTAEAAAPVVRTILGSPLTIAIADETSMQVADVTLGEGAFDFAPYCPTDTADSGVLVSLGGLVYGPDFASHPCGTRVTNAYVPWTPVSMSPVTGSGTTTDPFEVVVVVDAGATGLRLTETLSYVNGSTAIRPSLVFSSTAAAPIAWNTFLAADVSMNNGYGFNMGNAPGAQQAGNMGAPFPVCGQSFPYYILFPPGSRYSSNQPDQVWNEISSGTLSNTSYYGCPWIGLATEWEGLTLDTGGTLTVNDRGSVSFIPAYRDPSTAIPALSRIGLASLVAGLALAGWLLSKRSV